MSTAPTRPWAMAMRWHDLLFAHWPIDPERLRAVVPPALELDTFDGQAWLGIVPFRMSGIRARCLPALPGVSRFPELNVRTYVRHGARPGVYFFSLDAAEWLAVRVARRLFRLPYYDAVMSCEPDGDGIAYRSRRTHRGAPEAILETRYGPCGDPERAPGGSLAHFLTERYCLYTEHAGVVRRGDIHHEPWPLQPARWEVQRCEMTRLLGLQLPAVEPTLYFARDLAVRAWLPVAVEEP